MIHQIKPFWTAQSGQHWKPEKNHRTEATVVTEDVQKSVISFAAELWVLSALAWGSCGTTVPVVLGKTGDVVLNEKKFDLSPIAFSYQRLVTTGPNYNYLTCPSFCCPSFCDLSLLLRPAVRLALRTVGNKRSQ